MNDARAQIDALNATLADIRERINRIVTEDERRLRQASAAATPEGPGPQGTQTD